MSKEPKIPDWMADLPDHALIGSVEIAQIYGILKNSAPRSVERGNLPKPARKLRGLRGKHFWRLGDIREHVKALASDRASAGTL